MILLYINVLMYINSQKRTFQKKTRQPKRGMALADNGVVIWVTDPLKCFE